MIAGPGHHLLLHGDEPALAARRLRRHQPDADLWFGILPISAGVFGVPLGFAVIIIVSLLTPAPSKDVQELVEHVRYPSVKLAGKA